jgi:hypothetical protein
LGVADFAYLLYFSDAASAGFVPHRRASALPGAAAKSGEMRFLRIALEKMGLA